MPTCAQSRARRSRSADAQQRLAIRVGEKTLGELRQCDEVAALRLEEPSLRRESADSRPMRRPDTRNTKRAATSRGPGPECVERREEEEVEAGGRQEGGDHPRPALPHRGARKTARSRRRAIEESVSAGKSLRSAIVAATTRTEAGYPIHRGAHFIARTFYGAGVMQSASRRRRSRRDSHGRRLPRRQRALVPGPQGQTSMTRVERGGGSWSGARRWFGVRSRA